MARRKSMGGLEEIEEFAWWVVWEDVMEVCLVKNCVDCLGTGSGRIG